MASLVAVTFFRDRITERLDGGAPDRATAQPSEAEPPPGERSAPFEPVAAPSGEEEATARPTVVPFVPASAPLAAPSAAPSARSLAGKPRAVPASRPPPKRSAGAAPDRSGTRRDPDEKPQSIYGVR